MTARDVAGLQQASPPARSSLSAALREATHLVHLRLERALPLLDRALTLDGYRRIVQAFYGFHAPLERALLAAGATHPGAAPLAGREKRSWLVADLRALGLTDEAISALPVALPPDVSTRARALGSLYVVEGATLGGRFILGALEENLSLGPASGARFFAGYGAATGEQWRAFLAGLEAAEVRRDEATSAAVETFTALEGWLHARGVLR